ncbi:MOSC domain-containing protein [Gottschalkia acidurici 9a]|uniref:MOSC domain-containing protein n=1 Tax=Gottschalkia acidurici (strain ATCC 7906 / DSM 604 / BCRC 14475 / CIP 104303 / KCTC 5404 / NCIMB 10678 / 9a) TaxID=1128398 RepID=K0B454_GOTA9|nr:MOSC domain-containing protein [Gottschalkia acidurici]AFS79887.1 MOSC domain-containing protein [Gottschalkia acidurici 9a]
MLGRLSRIYICEEKGKPRELVEIAFLKEDFGMVGDCHSGTGNSNKQLVILLSKDRRDIEESYSNRGICTKRFKENILLDDISLEDLKIGMKVKIGESIVEIKSLGKRCFAECDLVKAQSICPLKEGAIFAKVIQSGKIKVNDSVTVLK